MGAGKVLDKRWSHHLHLEVRTEVLRNPKTWSKHISWAKNPGLQILPHAAPIGQGLRAARDGLFPLTKGHASLASCLLLFPKPAQVMSLGYLSAWEANRGEEEEGQNNVSC